MQQLWDKNTYKKLDSCIDSKVQSNLSRFLRKYKMFFKCHESMVKESAINAQNSKTIESFEPNFKLRPTVAGPDCSTRKLSQLIETIKTLLKTHQKIYLQ